MIQVTNRCALIAALAVGSVTISACQVTTPGVYRGGTSVHLGYGRSPFGYYNEFYPDRPSRPVGGGADYGGGWGGGSFGGFSDF